MKIAILRRGGIGDLICTAPLVYSLLENIPGAQITLFVEKGGAGLLPYLFPNVQCALIGSGNKYFQALKLAYSFRNQFDMAISAKTTEMKLNDRFLRVLNAPISMAVSQTCKISHPRPAQKSGHQALRCLKIFDPHLEEIPLKWFPKITPPSTPVLVDLPKPILLFSLSNRRAASQLAWDRFTAIANRLPFSILINSLAPHEDALSLKKALKVPSQILPTPEMGSFLRAVASSDLVLTGDGGLCHVAAALNRPQLALYACTPLDLWRPLGPASCLFDFQNVNRIDPEKIFIELSRFL